LANGRKFAYKCDVDLRARIEENIREHQLLKDGAAALLGVSGGVDSMVLLHLFEELAPAHRWSLAVAHFNHCLRGAESDADEAFVRSAAAQGNFSFHSAADDVRAFAQNGGISIEMAARELRHRFLIETARHTGIHQIVLAHHEDDNLETFWLRLLRGDVGRGLVGMRWKRPTGKEEVIQFIRPLLNVRKQDLQEYAAEREIPFREDASNADPAFLRNRLRLEILPRLEAFQPALRHVVSRSLEVLTAEKAFLEEEAQRWLGNPDRDFSVLHIALQRELIRQQLIRLGISPNFDRIEELRTTTDIPVSVSSTERVSRSPRGLLMMDRPAPLEFSGQKQAIDVSVPGQCTFDGVDFEWEAMESRGAAAPGVEYFDADSVGKAVVIRRWAPGDRFQPSGLAAESKLQDLFTNQKIAADEKRQRLVAEAEDGKILWVEGLRISERHKVKPQTRQVLKWTWRRER
jgi:tRNA(Ile)-lysidine synthase